MPTLEKYFDQEYKRLNKAQREAVDTIEGPVMVVAGPGTGKTQILALRIGNILQKTDTKADGILCLTFTNAAVQAMRERLRAYIGSEASKVTISTFHSFAFTLIESFYPVLGLSNAPTLIDEQEGVLLADHILQENDWEYIRPRSDTSRYFADLKSLISFLKREGINPKEFEVEIKREMKTIEHDPLSISSRGESKGKLKQDALKKIEGLARTLEAVRFYELYEEKKRENNLYDYDDVLRALVSIVEESEEARSAIKENFLYVLVDEHQDSSGIQNEFLTTVWGNEDRPNIFVVGDDRQLIYGFGGASLEYFQNFKNAFGKATLVTLVDNYRSTQKILDAAHELLQSSLVSDRLVSHRKEDHPLRLVETYYPREEIIFAGLEITQKLNEGTDPNDMAILVPKNHQVRTAVQILKDMNIPVAEGETLNFFDVPEAVSFLRVLRIMADPGDSVCFALSFLDPLSGIPPLQAHQFLRAINMRNFSLLDTKKRQENLFGELTEHDKASLWIEKLRTWLADSHLPLYSFIQKVGTELLLDQANDHDELVHRVEVLRTLLHLVLFKTEKEPRMRLSDFLAFLGRLEAYGECVPLAVFAPDEGVRVLTLHGSKGLEFDCVWIAHMDERSLSGSKRDGFSLPERIKEKVHTRDELTQKRELYVAITRAKRFCTILYSQKSYTGTEQELAHIIADNAAHFEHQSAKETEKIILRGNERAYVENKRSKRESMHLDALTKLVAADYCDRKISVSLLNNFFECPWKWYFRNLLQLPESKSESLEFGNIIHGSIDAVLKYGKTPTSKTLEQIITDEVARSRFGDERKQKELSTLASRIISRWAMLRLKDIATEREHEHSISLRDDTFPHLQLYGKIDLIEHLDKECVRVTDFKTGSVRKKSEIEKCDGEGRMSPYMRQLAMYSYLLSKNQKWKKRVSGSRLEFLEAKTPTEIFYDTVVTDDHLKLLLKDIADYDTCVKNGEWIKRPCNYNSYGKNTPCEYCKLAQVYK